MALTAPYKQHNYMGEHATIAAVLSLIQANKWDSNGNGTGTPRAGMTYFDTALGMLMYWDSRSKWLSIDSVSIPFGGAGNVAAGSYYAYADGVLFNTTRGYTSIYPATIVALSYTRDDTDSATFEVTEGGAVRATLASTAISGYSNSLDGNVAQGGVIGVRNQTGGNATNDVLGLILVKARGT